MRKIIVLLEVQLKSPHNKKMRKKKRDFSPGDIFLIPLINGKFSVGHVLDQRMINTVRIALYNEIVEFPEKVTSDQLCNLKNLISLIEVTKEQLVYGVWRIIGNKTTNIPYSEFPNEKFRLSKWVGSTVYDAGLAEDFINAYFSLKPWDDWFNPNYLDKFLIDINKKPKHLILIKS